MDMVRLCVRFPDDVVIRVKKMAKERGVAEAEMWRAIVLRGLDSESNIATKYLIEALCVSRRLAASVDVDILKKAQSDADDILARLGIVNFNRSEET